MKYSAIILAFVAAVAAQSATELAGAIPACAKPSLDEAAKNVGCEITDYACQCGEKREALTLEASPKVVSACGTEAAAVLEATTALCDFVAENPDAAGGQSSAAAETTAAPSESAAESTAASATDSASGVQASLSSAVSSVGSEASGQASSKIADLTSAAAAATSAVAPNAAGMNAVNMGAMLGAAGVVAAMI